MNSRVLLLRCDFNTHNNSFYLNMKVNSGTTVTYQLRYTVVMCCFQCLHPQPVFQKTQL